MVRCYRVSINDLVNELGSRTFSSSAHSAPRMVQKSDQASSLPEMVSFRVGFTPSEPTSHKGVFFYQFNICK